MTDYDKFCVDCRHRSADRCIRAPMPGLNTEFGEWLATGQGDRPPEHQYYFCRIERASLALAACGSSGWFWEAKT